MNKLLNHRFLRWGVLLIIILCNAGCDQFSKKMVRDHIDTHAQIELVKNYFTLTNVENTGAFLSLGENLPNPLKRLVLTFLPVIVLSYMVFLVLFNRTLPLLIAIGLAFIIGGGFGNIYDRLRFGSVTDFLHLDFNYFQTGIFNFADLSITLGTILVIMSWLIKPPKA